MGFSLQKIRAIMPNGDLGWQSHNGQRYVFDNHDNKTGSRYAVIIYYRKRYQAQVAFI